MRLLHCTCCKPSGGAGHSGTLPTLVAPFLLADYKGKNKSVENGRERGFKVDAHLPLVDEMVRVVCLGDAAPRGILHEL